MFDCVMPTRNARNGHLFIDTGILKLEMPPIELMKGRLISIATVTPARTTAVHTFII